MDSSTGEQCKKLEDSVGGAQAMADLTGTTHRPNVADNGELFNMVETENAVEGVRATKRDRGAGQISPADIGGTGMYGA